MLEYNWHFVVEPIVNKNRSVKNLCQTREFCCIVVWSGNGVSDIKMIDLWNALFIHHKYNYQPIRKEMNTETFWWIMSIYTLYSIYLFIIYLSIYLFIYNFSFQIFSLLTFQMLSPFLVSSPEISLALPPTFPHQHCYPHFLVLAFLYHGTSRLHRTKGLSSHWCPTRPPSAIYAAGAMGPSMCNLWLVV